MVGHCPAPLGAGRVGQALAHCPCARCPSRAPLWGSRGATAGRDGAQDTFTTLMVPEPLSPQQGTRMPAAVAALGPSRVLAWHTLALPWLAQQPPGWALLCGCRVPCPAADGAEALAGLSLPLPQGCTGWEQPSALPLLMPSPCLARRNPQVPAAASRCPLPALCPRQRLGPAVPGWQSPASGGGHPPGPAGAQCPTAGFGALLRGWYPNVGMELGREEVPSQRRMVRDTPRGAWARRRWVGMVLLAHSCAPLLSAW